MTFAILKSMLRLNIGFTGGGGPLGGGGVQTFLPPLRDSAPSPTKGPHIWYYFSTAIFGWLTLKFSKGILAQTYTQFEGGSVAGKTELFGLLLWKIVCGADICSN